MAGGPPPPPLRPREGAAPPHSPHPPPGGWRAPARGTPRTSGPRQRGPPRASPRTDAVVTDVNDHEVRIGERSVSTHTVLWGAGVQASPLARSLGVPLDRAGRVLVEPELTIPGHKQVFVLGDLAAVKQRDGSYVPG